jgi:hypothetical protein
MKPMYMKESYTGAYSAIQYGLKGDIVYIIKREADGFVCVVNQNDLRFWIQETKLSTEKIEKDAIIPTKQRTKR